MFWVDIGLDRLADISDQVRLGRTGYLCILTRDGRVVYHPRLELIGNPADPQLLAGLGNGGNGRFRARVDGKEMLYLSQVSPHTGWRLLAVVPQAEVTGASHSSSSSPP